MVYCDIPNVSGLSWKTQEKIWIYSVITGRMFLPLSFFVGLLQSLQILKRLQKTTMLAHLGAGYLLLQPGLNWAKREISPGLASTGAGSSWHRILLRELKTALAWCWIFV